MNFKEYSESAHEFAEYEFPVYPFLALAEEVGEFLTYPAKNARGDERYKVLDEHQDAMLKEVGDILWQLNECCIVMGIDLDTAAKMNIQKLSKRLASNMIKGDGDEERT